MRSLSFNPKRCILEVTYQCNLRCRTCSMWTPHFTKKKASRANPSYDTLLRIQSRLAENGIKRITYLGGEPFMRNDICGIAGGAKRAGLSPAVVTNGTRIDADTAGEIVNEQLFDVMIFSIDGPDHIHDALRGKAGTFKRATETVRCIQKLKKKSRFKNPRIFMYATLSAVNYLYVDKLVSIAQQLDVESIRLLSASRLTQSVINKTNQVFKTQVISTHNYMVQDDIKMYGLAHAYVRARLPLLHERCRKAGITLQVEQILHNGRGARSCEILGRDCVVSPEGSVYPCPMLPQYTIGNILRDSLREMFVSRAFKELYLHYAKKHIPVCNECCVEKLQKTNIQYPIIN